VSGSGEVTAVERLGALAAAAHISSRFVPGDLQAEIDVLSARADERRQAGVDLTVVGIAGSTGSGKSSLFNALTGLDLAETGVRRPTTLTTSACVFGEDDGSAVLDWLGVATSRRVTHRSLLDERTDVAAGLVLLDLPDHDSMVDSHREEVDRLVPRVDALVWVTDPVKYADAALHLDYLRRLSRHDAVVTVVLNQVDRLDAADLALCLDDLRRLVVRDGLSECALLATSATTRHGLDALGRHLVSVAAARRAVDERLSADVLDLADRLSGELALVDKRPADTVVDPGAVETEVVDAMALDVRERAVSAQRLAQARRHLRWPVLGGSDIGSEPVLRTRPPAGLDDLRTIVTGHVRRVGDVLAEPWAAEIGETVRSDEIAARWSQQGEQIDALADQPVPSRWSGHRRAEWAVLGLAVLSALVAVLLGVAVLVTGSVPVALWALPAIGGLLACGGVVLLNRRARAYREDWAVTSVSSARAAAEAAVRDSVRRDLVEPVRRAEREIADTSAALARAGR
jgi:GTP-binding protein EngB required for normal cell division